MALRNVAKASSRVIAPCVTIVIFLPPALRCPGSTNDLHVTDEIQATSSGSSTSGLRFSLMARFPRGIFWHVLKPSSVTGCDDDGVLGIVVGGGATTGGGTTRGTKAPRAIRSCPAS